MFVSAIGAVPSPFDCFLVNRGLKTLPCRMKAHMENGFAVARWLEANPRVTKVLHPGERQLPERTCWHIVIIAAVVVMAVVAMMLLVYDGRDCVSSFDDDCT